MTKKNYIVFAEAIKEAIQQADKENNNNEILGYIISNIEKVFKVDNEKFDIVKFEDAIYG